MLKKIPKIISPELLKILSEMGHGDELVIADGNFPSAALNDRVVRYDGNNIPELMTAILELYPLDSYADHQVFLMGISEGDSYEPTIWNEYTEILKKSGEPYSVKYLERFEFYEQAKNAYAVVATGEEALYANIIIKKGVIK